MIFLEKIQKLEQNKKENASRFLLKEMYRNNLALTCKELLEYKDINNHTHQEMIQCLESETKRKLIVMPRGTFKSSICSVGYPISLLNKNPNLRILLDGEVYTNSKNFLREIKLHMINSRLTNIFGKYETRRCWTEGEIIISQRTKVLKEASITASGVGSEKTGQHYDVIIMDDLNSPSNSHTKEGREKVLQHYRYNTSILEPNGIMVIVGTRYAEDDLIGFILKNEMEIIRPDNKLHEEKQPVYMVCGVPGSGKTWVCEQLKSKFTYLPNDRFIGKDYAVHIREEAKVSQRPILIDCPFGERVLKERLLNYGIKVIPYFIVEGAHVIRYRYEKREGKLIPSQHLTRSVTIKDRALEWGAIHGTSDFILKTLNELTLER